MASTKVMGRLLRGVWFWPTAARQWEILRALGEVKFCQSAESLESRNDNKLYFEPVATCVPA